jgi:hypothetical protein
VRALRRLIVLGLVLLALAGLADYGARRLVEDQVGRQIAASESLPAQPEVSISGFPFLTQAAAGSFRRVTVRSGAVAANGGVAVESVEARLDDVTVPVREVLAGQVPDVRIGAAQVEGIVPYPVITRLITAQVQDVVTDVQVRHTGGDTLALSGSYLGFALELPLQVRLSGSQLVIGVPGAALATAPAAVRAPLTALETRLTVPALPYGLTVQSLQLTGAGLSLRATATDLVLEAAD